jgi:hypothetical protein
MHQQIVRHLRANVVAYLALCVAVAGGGGYALAANRSTATQVCADRGGARLLHLQAQCHRGQQALSWVQTDVPISQAALWARVDSAGRVVDGAGFRVRHLATGTYSLAVTGPCSQVANSPVVSVIDNNPPFPPNGFAYPAGAHPVAWLGYNGAGDPLMVYTGVVANGSFTATDRDFDIQDFC